MLTFTVRLSQMKEFEKSHKRWSKAEKKSFWSSHYAQESKLLRERRTRLKLSDVTILAKLGKGGYGDVYLCRKNDSGELMATKKMKKSSFEHNNEVHKARIEREVLSQGSSARSRLVQMLYCFDTRDDLYMCMEYVPGGDIKHLLDNLGCIEEEDAKFYFAEMLLAVDELHKLGYIHRDLKPDNYMIDKNGHLKLIDFGLSKEGWNDKYDQKRGSEDSIVGSPEYIAVEILKGQNYTYLADYWSLGVILYEMITSTTPFTSSSPEQVFENVMNFKKGHGIKGGELTGIASDECWNLIECLIEEPEKRIGKNGIADIKGHPWFAGFDWDRIDDMEPPFVPNLSDEADTSYFDSNKQLENENFDDDLLASDFNDDIISISSDKSISDTSDIMSYSTIYSDESQFEWSGFSWRRSSYDPLSHFKKIPNHSRKRMSESDITNSQSYMMFIQKLKNQSEMRKR